jgi:hypothetical protein
MVKLWSRYGQVIVVYIEGLIRTSRKKIPCTAYGSIYLWGARVAQLAPHPPLQWYTIISHATLCIQVSLYKTPFTLAQSLLRCFAMENHDAKKKQ